MTELPCPHGNVSTVTCNQCNEAEAGVCEVCGYWLSAGETTCPECHPESAGSHGGVAEGGWLSETWLAGMEAIYYNGHDDPDGWMIRHGRAYDSCHFGPFATLREAAEWAEKHPHVTPQFVPLFLTVDWGR
jgi:hypothetical protein